jgi:hypothetical protein
MGGVARGLDSGRTATRKPVAGGSCPSASHEVEAVITRWAGPHQPWSGRPPRRRDSTRLRGSAGAARTSQTPSRSTALVAAGPMRPTRGRSPSGSAPDRRPRPSIDLDVATRTTRPPGATMSSALNEYMMSMGVFGPHRPRSGSPTRPRVRDRRGWLRRRHSLAQRSPRPA